MLYYTSIQYYFYVAIENELTYKQTLSKPAAIQDQDLWGLSPAQKALKCNAF